MDLMLGVKDRGESRITVRFGPAKLEGWPLTCFAQPSPPLATTTLFSVSISSILYCFGLVLVFRFHI